MTLVSRPGILTVCLLIAALAGCGSSSEKPEQEEEVFDQGPGYPYETEIVGAPTAADRAILEQGLRLYTLADRPPATEARLRHRVEGDLDYVERLLRSDGYLQGKARYRLLSPDENEAAKAEAAARSVEKSGVEGTQEPSGETREEDLPEAESPPQPKARVIIEMEPGERFTFGGYEFEPPSIDGIEPYPDLAALGLELGQPAAAAKVVGAEKRLVRWLQDQGFPHATFSKRHVSAQSDTHQMFIVSTIDPGPRLSLGAPEFSGLRSVEEPYLETYLNWSEGEPVSRSTLEAYQQRLYGTGLFESVSVKVPAKDKLPETGAGTEDARQVPVSVLTTEAQHRTVGAGVSYSTVEEFGVNGVLEHRNLFGSNEIGRFEANIATKDQRVALIYEKPQFLMHDQRLQTGALYYHEDDDAFTVKAYQLFLNVERRVSKRLTVSAGVMGENAQVSDVPITGTSKLLLMPLRAGYDASDDKLDPTRGYRVGAVVTPAVGTFRDDPLSFTHVDLTASVYWGFGDKPLHVLALRGRVGSLVGASRDSIPAHRRLYSGGGGSVRAYDRRFIGPIDDDGDPLGGRSVAEVGLEARLRVGENLGVVPFIEAGSVTDTAYPDFDEGVQSGYGLGLRYYTPIGPMRADVAFPIDRREVDDAFQFYISIGQAF